MIDEEKTYKEFGVKTINLKQAESHLRKQPQEFSLFGEPYYQPFKIFEYWLHFNNSNYNEEKSIKLLLNLPLIS